MTALGVYGLGVMMVITLGSFILSKKKASKEFEENIYNETLNNEIKIED
jgi:NSS family neurotransmitter:Na+ symporter